MSAEEHRPLLGEAQQHQEEQQTGAMAGDSRESVTMPGLMGKNLFTDAHALVAEVSWPHSHCLQRAERLSC